MTPSTQYLTYDFELQILVLIYLFLLRFIPHNAKQKLQGMELQNKENNGEKHIEKPIGKTPMTLVNDQVSSYLKVKEISIDVEVQINT